jgi:hypothetical protein
MGSTYSSFAWLWSTFFAELDALAALPRSRCDDWFIATVVQLLEDHGVI